MLKKCNYSFDKWYKKYYNINGFTNGERKCYKPF